MPTSSIWMSLDCSLTIVTTLFLPFFVDTFSYSSSVPAPPPLTFRLKVSSDGCVDSMTSTVIWLPDGPDSSAVTR